ncbi:MAG: response regulator [Bacillota bacterium]|jgi:two-component system response regulator YesN|nr:response regulator [Bacillota bacterium]
MYQLLIVEDEKWEREGLKDFLDWESLGIKVSGCACNGVEGKKMAEELNPHIIITDIKMPLMDGIQMAREIRAFLPDAKIIILTGYDEFEYAKQTFDFHAFAYLLKPIRRKDLEQVINNVLNDLDHEESIIKEINALKSEWTEYASKNRDYLLIDFLKQKTELTHIYELPLMRWLDTFKNKLVAILSLYPGKYEGNPVTCTPRDVTKLLNTILGTRGIAVSCSELQEDIVMCIDAPPDIRELEAVLLQMMDEIKKRFGTDCIAGVGEIVNGLESMPRSYTQAREAISFRFIANYHDVLFYGSIKDVERNNWDLTGQLIEKADSLSSKIVHCIQKGDMNQSTRLVDDFLAMLRENLSGAKILFNRFIMNIINGLNTILANSTEEDGVYVSLWDHEKQGVDYTMLDSLSQTRNYLTGFLSRIAVNMEKDCHEDNIARTVLKIIEEKYPEELNLKRVSKEINLYPYYIGSIFKEYTGKSFNEYLNYYRIDKAKEMLHYKNMKVSDLAESVGIPNASYFCCLFKKRFGISPGEYGELVNRRPKGV